VSQSKDSFYGEVEPDRQPLAEELNARRKAWIAGGAVCSEMEASTVFVVSSILHKRAGGVMLIVDSQFAAGGHEPHHQNLERLISTGIEAIKLLILQDRATTR
jgi:uridine phosphorylase